MALTFKQKFNKKHGQPLDTPNSLTKIARLSGISYRNIKKYLKRERGLGRVLDHQDPVCKSSNGPTELMRKKASTRR